MGAKQLPSSCCVLQVHLLNDERGAVIETLIARTQRTVSGSQGAQGL